MAKMALGRGLGALLPTEDSGEKQVQEVVKEKYQLDDKDVANSTRKVAVQLIDPNPFQPRIEFQAEALEELKNSILEHGVIQPLSVRPKANGRYELIAGERRLRACKLAGLIEVPVYILQIATDAEMLELAIIENIQRKDLNPIEVAKSYKRLMDDCDLTQEQVSKRVAKDRTTVTNALRLLKLPDFVQHGLVSEQLSMGHARALVSVDDQAFLKSLFTAIIEEDLSVREIEKRVKAGPPKKQVGAKTPIEKPKPNVQEVEKRIMDKLSTRVKVKEKGNGQGEVAIEFYSYDDLERLLDLFESIHHA